MKIKSWIRSIHIVMLLTVLITLISCLYILKEQSEVREELVASHIKKKLSTYDNILSDGRIYKQGYDFSSLLYEDGIDVDIYMPGGILIYSTNKNNTSTLGLNVSEIYKDLYKIKFVDGRPTATKLALLNGRIAGLYRVTLSEKANNWAYICYFNVACIILGVTTLISLCVISRIINTKLTRPIDRLSNAMTRFAKGENVKISISGNNELTMLSRAFNNMREEIIEKNRIIEQEKKAREYMIATITHDLKSPLTSIRVYSELLSSGEENINRCTRIIMDKCDYMNVMIEDLLTYSVLKSENPIELVTVDGEEFFTMIFGGYDSICENKNILYESNIVCSGEYNVNVKEMMRVVDNLIFNAIKYTNEGNKIYTGVYSSEYGLPSWIDFDFIDEIKVMQSEGLVVIVKNQGDYIDSKKIEHIFDPFYKCDDNKSSKGTGLGLSIVKLIVEKHNGEVKLYSKKDSGNIFAFNLKRLR